MSLNEFFGKNYKFQSNENYEQYLKECAIDLCTRAIESKLNPTFNIKMEGDQYVVTRMVSILSDVVFNFTPGVEFELKKIDGTYQKNICTINGNTINQIRTDPNGRQAFVQWMFSPEELKMVMTCNNVTATRIFKAE